MTKEMQVALNVPDYVLLLAGYIWHEEHKYWLYAPNYDKRHCGEHKQNDRENAET